MGTHSFLFFISRHISSYNTAYIMFKTLIFALLVVSAVALPYGSKKAKPVHVPKHPAPAPADDHPVEVAVKVVVEVVPEEEPIVEEETPVEEEEEPVAEEEPTPVKYHPAKKAHKKHHAPKKPAH